MPDRGQQHTTASVVDDDGVRTIRNPAASFRWLLVASIAVLLLALWLGLFVLRSSASPGVSQSKSTPSTAAESAVEPREASDRPARVQTVRPGLSAAARAQAEALIESFDRDSISGDANDIASYVSPTDDEPSAAELIEALRDSGDYGGIAAFNPPGTSPPLLGLVVPEDFVLPEGYVRHHQVTDEGEPLEAILMFSPDYVFFDDSGLAIALPEDLIVPPEMAPPGMPIRPIEPPPP